MGAPMVRHEPRRVSRARNGWLQGAVAGSIAAASLALAGCSNEAASDAGAESEAEVERTLAAALKSEGELSTVGSAIDDAGLSGVFDGPGSYTVLAPNDAAFSALGSSGEAMMAEDGRALLVAVLRDHIMPGHLEPDAIRAAIEKNGGPVEMGTLGEGTVTFSLDADRIAVGGAGENAGHLIGDPLVARNGVVLPVDALLKDVPASDQ